MANTIVPILQLPESTQVNLNDYLPIVDNGITKRVTVAKFLEEGVGNATCYVATTAALTATYDNGIFGVGATLTNAGTLATLSIDGVSLLIQFGSRVLVKNQADPIQNGIYTVTISGDGSTAWVLTRSLDYDTVANIDPGDFFTVAFGTVNAKTQWIQTSTITAVGISSITFESNIIAGSGITKTNNSLSVSSSVFNSISTQIFTSSGTYTPTTRMAFCIVEMVGGGGGSGGTIGGVSQASASAGGGGGGYCRKIFTSANIGSSSAIVIGSGGSAGLAGDHVGGNGSDSTFTPAGTGSILTASGGIGGGSGGSSSTSTTSISNDGGLGGTSTNGDINIRGGFGGTGFIISGANGQGLGGIGGSTNLSNFVTSHQLGGFDGLLYGGGASGVVNASNSDAIGKLGASGICIITEYILV